MAYALAYSSVDGVRPRLGGRPLNLTSKPSISDVEAWLSDGEARLDATLVSVGVSAPVTSERGIAVCRSVVEGYAQGLAMQIYAGAGGGNDNDGNPQTQRFEDFLKWILDHPSQAGAMMDANGIAPAVTIGVASAWSDDSAPPRFTVDTEL